MLEFHNAKERDVDDWAKILSEAHPSFHLQAIRKPPGSRLAILEVTWLDHESEAHI